MHIINGTLELRMEILHGTKSKGWAESTRYPTALEESNSVKQLQAY